MLSYKQATQNDEKSYRSNSYQMFSYFKQVEDLNINWMYEKKHVTSAATTLATSRINNPLEKSASRLNTINSMEQTLVNINNLEGNERFNIKNDAFFSNLSSKTAINWESYDDITRIGLEIMFHQYYKSNFDGKYRYVSINPSFKIDLKEWYEIDNDD